MMGQWGLRMRALLLAMGLTLRLSFCVPLMDVDVQQLRKLASKYNVTSLLVFGDSSVDPGNNNVLSTTMKSNFPPYGKDFFNARPTGRFCDGRLATDFIGKLITFNLICFISFLIHY